jgi:hypothetical protein
MYRYTILLFVLLLNACGTPATGQLPAESPSISAPTDVLAPTESPATPASSPTPVVVVVPSATPTAAPEPTSVTIQPAVTANATPASAGPIPVATAAEPMEVSMIPDTIMAKLRADLVQRTGVAESDIIVVSGEAVSWSDSSLGCPQPGMNYMQVITDGYRVILEANGTKYDYRVGRNEAFLLCNP